MRELPKALSSKLKEIGQSKHKAGAEIAFDIQKSHSVDHKYSKVLIQVPSIHRERLNDSAMQATVASKLGDGVRYLPNSLHRASLKDPSLYAMMVARNTRTISMETASAEGFTAVSDTVFQDKNDDIWAVVKEGDTAFLVQQNVEDVNSLLLAARARSIATASLAVSMVDEYGPGMSVLYYDTQAEEVAFGVAIDGTSIYNGEKHEIASVDPAMVLNVYDKEVATWDKSEVATNDGNKTVALEFFKKLYGHHKEFLAEIQNILRNHVAV